MSSKYDLLITIDPSDGINPGSSDRAYYPGQNIKGFIDLTVYESIAIDQIQVALLGFQETTLATVVPGHSKNDPRIWKEKHIFLKQHDIVLPAKGSPYKYHNNDTHHALYNFNIPQYSLCETCRKTEVLPPSMEEARAVANNKVVATASITYQVEVSIESRTGGTIYFNEKFVVQPVATSGPAQYHNDAKRNYVYGDRVFRSKRPEGTGAAAGSGGAKKSGFRSMFSSNSMSGSKTYNVPLSIGIRPEESHVSIQPGRNISIPPTAFLFVYRGDSISSPPFISSNKASTGLGKFVISSLSITTRYPHIKTYTAGREGSVSSLKTLYVNNNLNTTFDIGSEFTYNKSTNTFEKELLLIEDIVGHIIDIPLELYDAEFPMHCNQIARRGGALEFTIGLNALSEIEAGKKPEHIAVTVPFSFLGVEEDFSSPAGPPPGISAQGNYPPPPGPPPGGDVKHPDGPGHDEFAPPSGPPPGDFKHPDGPPGNAPPSGYSKPPGPPPGDYKHPDGPGHEASGYSAPSGPPPGSSAPPGPPPGPPPARAPTEPLIDLNSDDLPKYTETPK